MWRACVLYVSNKVHARYMRVEDALNAFGTHSRNVYTTCIYYVPGGQGVSDNSDQNGRINVRQRRRTG